MKEQWNKSKIKPGDNTDRRLLLVVCFNSCTFMESWTYSAGRGKAHARAHRQEVAIKKFASSFAPQRQNNVRIRLKASTCRLVWYDPGALVIDAWRTAESDCIQKVSYCIDTCVTSAASQKKKRKEIKPEIRRRDPGLIADGVSRTPRWRRCPSASCEIGAKICTAPIQPKPCRYWLTAISKQKQTIQLLYCCSIKTNPPGLRS